jgi:RNA polymerase sigma-70 factor (ECF subfamily)
MALWRRANQFDASSGSLAGWLLGIARHRAIDRYRAESRRPTATAVSLADSFNVEPVFAEPPSGVANDIDPTEVAELHWRQSVVRTLLADLPDGERDVLMLAYGSGLSQTEIAERTGTPLGTVKSRTRRALAHLRLRMASVPDLVDEGFAP